MEQEPEPVWKRGDIYLNCKSKVYKSKKGETPSSFLARVIKDRDAHGCGTWDYLKKEMEG